MGHRFADDVEKDGCAKCTADGLKVKGYRGVAFWAAGHPITRGEEWVPDPEAPEGGFWEATETLETGQLVAIMYGDNRRHVIDADDAEPIQREAFCGECGQTGCTHDGLTRRDEPVTAEA